MVLLIFVFEFVKVCVDFFYFIWFMVFGELFDLEMVVKVGYFDCVVEVDVLLVIVKVIVDVLKLLSGFLLIGNK